MTAAAPDIAARPDERPERLIQPDDDHAIRALKALEEDRLPDAQKHAALIAETSLLDRAWKFLINGLIALARNDFAAAEPQLWQSTALSVTASESAEEPPCRAALRVAARAMERIGRLLRRSESHDAAYQVHLAAYRLRNRHGSPDELWESACSLGLDAQVDGRHAEAEKWYLRAVEIAESCRRDRNRMLDVAWTHLAIARTEAARPAEAVEAARAARDWRQQHEGGSLSFVRADVRLAHALMRFGESLYNENPRQASEALSEAVARFTTAREELLPYGDEAAADVVWCETQLDFARRLQASLPE